jgi:hypothetical protein
MVLILGVGSCATPVLPRRPPGAIRIGCGDATIAVRGPQDDVARVVGALPAACARLYGAGLAPTGAVPLRIHEDVDGFVDATGQLVDTLRAWSTIDGVDVLTPASWHRRDDEALRRRMAHELCHVALFQRTRAGRPPPRALAEGICSVAAGQTDERLPLDDVRRRTAAGETIDFVDDSAFAYGVAHHVAEGIWRCRGPEGLLAAVDSMSGGVDISVALGAPPFAFLDGCPGSDQPMEALESRP